MRPLPAKLRKRLKDDPFMKACVSCGGTQDIEWEHCWLHKNKQINEAWSIVPLCMRCHRGNNGTVRSGVKDKARKASIERLIWSGFENLEKYRKPMDDTWENRINFYTKHI